MTRNLSENCLVKWVNLEDNDTMRNVLLYIALRDTYLKNNDFKRICSCKGGNSSDLRMRRRLRLRIRKKSFQYRSKDINSLCA